MSRRKQKTILETYPQQKNEIQVKSPSSSFIPEFPLSNKFTSMHTPDSLQRFQWQLQNSLLQKRQQWQNNYQSQKTRGNKKRAQTQYNESQPQDDLQRGISSSKLSKLQKELSELKSEIVVSKNNGLENKLDKLLEEMVKNRQADRQFFKQQRHSAATPQQPPNNIFYPPMPFYPQPPPSIYDQPRSREKQESRSRQKQEYRTRQKFQPRPKIKPKQNPYEQKSQTKSSKSVTVFPKLKKNNKVTKKLSIKKYFIAALFTKFLKKQSQTLARARKMNFRTFFIQKFDSQITSLKDWLVEGQQYALPVILQKEEISLQFWKERSDEVQKQKQELVLNLIKLGLQKTKKQCASHKITSFSQVLLRLCMRGSFVMSRFWSAYELENICVSEFYGCIRADESLEKYLIGMVVFVKLLIFNMILQPHKFDSQNFPKTNVKLSNNMYVLGSAYYKLIKQVLKQYLRQKRPSYYRLGNWLSVRQQFLVQCCEPLRFNVRYPTQGEWVSGLLDEQLDPLQKRSSWPLLKKKVQEIIDSLHKQIKRRRKDAVRTQKSKLYN